VYVPVFHSFQLLDQLPTTVMPLKAIRTPRTPCWFPTVSNKNMADGRTLRRERFYLDVH